MRMTITVMLIFCIVGCASINHQVYNDFLYREDGNFVTIIGYTGNDRNVIVPDNINNKPVKIIFEYAFRDNRYIESVSIPNTVDEIGAFAFTGCINIKNVYLLDSTEKNRFAIFNQDAFRRSSQEDIIISLSGSRDFETIYNKNNHIIQWLSVTEYISSIGPHNSFFIPLSTSYYIVFNNQIINPIPYDEKTEIKIEETTNNILFYYKEPRIRTGIRRGNNLIYFNGEQLLSTGNDVSILFNNNEIYFSIGSARSYNIYRNNQLLYQNVDNIKITRNRDVYYSKETQRIGTIYRNDIIIKQNIEGFSNFDVDDSGENIVYTVLENITFKLYKNDQLLTASNNFIFYPKISPNGNKIYYFEARQGPNNSMLFYVRGSDIPPIIAGPYLKPNGYGSFIFSNNSGYVACSVESFTRGMEGLYIILNDRLLGPYRNLSYNFYFTEDSKYFIYTHDGIEERIIL